jgi:YidC/Oxa1 family membrane protein insertase
MERRMLVAVLLSFFVVTLYGMATGQCQRPPKPEGDEVPADGTEDPAGKDGPVAPAPAPGPGDPAPGPGDPAPAPQPGDDAYPAQAADRAAKRITIRTQELEVVLTERGGAIEGITLRNSYENDKVRELVVVAPFANDLLLGQVDDTFLDPTALSKREGGYDPPGGEGREDLPPGPMRRYVWTYDEAGSKATEELDAIFTLQRADGATWRKQWVFIEDEGRFDVHLRLSLLPPAGQAIAPVAVKILVTSGLLREPPNGAAFQYPNTAILRLSRMDEADEGVDGFARPNLDDVDADDLRLLGARTHYYLATYFAEPDDPATADVRTWWGTRGDPDRREEQRERIAEFFRLKGETDPDTVWDPEEDPGLKERIRVGAHAQYQNWLVLEVPTQPDTYVDVPIYVGPIDRHVLDQPVYAAVEPVIEYKMAPDILADALLGIYDVFRGLFGSAGLAVILMTLVVRGLMMPLSIRNQLSMRGYSRKIAKVKPKLDALKKKYEKNVKKLREEQAKLYREHGIGFPTGCLMLLVQMPIFFALFSSLRTEYSLRNQAFLWIQDLGGPDKLIDFGHTVFDIGIITVFSLNILPLLMVGLSIWQQRMMPKPADEQQAQQMRMMKWMPIVFAVILYNYTAALALYMVLSSVVAIAESRIVRYKDAKDTEEGGAEGAWPGAAGMGM